MSTRAASSLDLVLSPGLRLEPEAIAVVQYRAIANRYRRLNLRNVYWKASFEWVGPARAIPALAPFAASRPPRLGRALLPAAIALQTALTVLSWVIEAGRNLGAAACTAGPARMLEALTRASQAAALRDQRPDLDHRASPPAFPDPCALIRALIRQQPDTTA